MIVTSAHGGASFQWTHASSKGVMTGGTVLWHWCDFDDSDGSDGLDEYDGMVVPNTPEGSLVDG